MTEVRPAKPEEQREALRLSLGVGQGSGGSNAAVVSSFTAHAAALSMDLSRQWVAVQGGRLVCACTLIPSAGGMAFLLAGAGFGERWGREAGAALLRRAEEWARGSGVRLIQCLTNPGQPSGDERALVEAGFFHLARLCYMEADTSAVKTATRAAEGSRQASWECYSEPNAGAFAEVIERTYADSQDCPGLSGVRTTAEAIAAHRAAGLFVPRRWQLLEWEGERRGVLLLNEVPYRPTLELAYMGVTAESRGRGLGRVLLRRAAQVAEQEGFAGLTLSVDARNVIARGLYSRCGFAERFSRDAWMCVLCGGSEG